MACTAHNDPPRGPSDPGQRVRRCDFPGPAGHPDRFVGNMSADGLDFKILYELDSMVAYDSSQATRPKPVMGLLTVRLSGVGTPVRTLAGLGAVLEQRNAERREGLWVMTGSAALFAVVATAVVLVLVL